MDTVTSASTTSTSASTLKRYRVTLSRGTSVHDMEVFAKTFSARNFTEAAGVAERYAMRLANTSVASITLV